MRETRYTPSIAYTKFRLQQTVSQPNVVDMIPWQLVVILSDLGAMHTGNAFYNRLVVIWVQRTLTVYFRMILM